MMNNSVVFFFQFNSAGNLPLDIATGETLLVITSSITDVTMMLNNSVVFFFSIQFGW